MPALFSPAPDVKSIGRELIREQERLAHLKQYQVPISYLFRHDVPKKSGRAVMGTCRLVRGYAAFLFQGGRWLDAREAPGDDDLQRANQPFFLVTMSHPVWKRLSEHQQRALTYHELRHAVAAPNERGDVVYGTVGHDWEGFADEIAQFGLWYDDAEQIAQACRAHLQSELPFTDKPFEAPPLGSQAGLPIVRNGHTHHTAFPIGMQNGGG